MNPLAGELLVLVMILGIPGSCVLGVLLSSRPPASPAPVPGSAVRRLGAAFIDALVLGVPFTAFSYAILAAYVSGLPQRMPIPEVIRHEQALRTIEGFLQLAALVVGWLYAAGMESSSFQATLGKMAMGLKVTDVEGRPVSFAGATGRHFGKVLSTLACLTGFLMIPFNRKKQGLHDLMAGTLVPLAHTGTSVGNPETDPRPAALASRPSAAITAPRDLFRS